MNENEVRVGGGRVAGTPLDVHKIVVRRGEDLEGTLAGVRGDLIGGGVVVE